MYPTMKSAACIGRGLETSLCGMQRSADQSILLRNFGMRLWSDAVALIKNSSAYCCLLMVARMSADMGVVSERQQYVTAGDSGQTEACLSSHTTFGHLYYGRARFGTIWIKKKEVRTLAAPLWFTLSTYDAHTWTTGRHAGRSTPQVHQSEVFSCTVRRVSTP